MRRSKALHLVALLIATAMIFASLPFAAALKLNVGVSSDDSNTWFGQFCWASKGGSMNGVVVSSVSEEVPLRILLCDSKDTTAIRFSGSSADACSVKSGACAYDIQLHSTRQLVNITDAEGFFGLFILNCQSKPYTIDIDLNLKNAGNEGLSCEYIGMPAISRRLAALWSIAFACCVLDFLYHFSVKNRRMDAWLTCQSVQPWVPICAGARLIQMFLAMKAYDDNSLYGRASPAVILVMYMFAAISEGYILAVCLLFAKGHITITQTLSINEKKQVIFVGLWLSISVFLNDLFRGFFLFSMIIAYICLCRIVYRRSSGVILALNAAARNARNLNNNGEGAKRMQWKALFIRTLLILLYIFSGVVCVVIVILAFVPYVRDIYISGFLIKDILLFLIFFLSCVVPRFLQWRFNYALEHDVADQMPNNDQFAGNFNLAGLFDARNFRQIETTETFCRSVHVVVPPFDEAAGEYPVISVAMHADERDDPARLNPAAAFFAAAREQAAAQAPQHPMSSRPMGSHIEMQAVGGDAHAAGGGGS